MRFKVTETAAERPAFAYSPAMEAVLSLHILVEPKHHPLHHEWVRAVRHRLTPGMKRVISGFRFAHASYLPPVLLPSALGPIPSQPSYDAELDRLRTLGPALGLEILRYFVEATNLDWAALADPVTQAAILRETARLGPSTFELTQLGLDDPGALADQFLDFLDRYWKVCFQAQWERTEPLLSAAIVDAGHAIARDGLFGMLSRQANIRVDPAAATFTVGTNPRKTAVVGRRSHLVIALSAFLWPHVSVINDPPHNLGLVCPVTSATDELTYRIPPRGLVPLLRALGDNTRLRALRLIADRPRSTQELAPLLHISEAAVSKHLRQLAQVGLVESHRDGYYILYTLRAGQPTQLSTSLLAFLDTDQHAPQRDRFSSS